MLMKNVLGRAATVALAAAVLPMTMSTTASASASANTVHWQNVATSVCVNWEEDWNQSVKLTPVGPCSTSNNLDSSQWREVSVDGKYWTFRPSRYATGGWSDLCLTSYNTLVYLEPCQDGNWWQQWEEIWTPNGWKLQHRGAGDVKGYYLDTDGSRLYTEPWNNGMNQVWK
ncbi:hypothetical protein M2167_001025 [Streptomyces sp. SPB4]|nr:hypothetical protein [Streptomyces sp. SPB4]